MEILKNEIYPESLEQLGGLSWEEKLRMLLANEDILFDSGMITAMKLTGDI